jgi:hypothetical protein
MIDAENTAWAPLVDPTLPPHQVDTRQIALQELSRYYDQKT